MALFKLTDMRCNVLCGYSEDDQRNDYVQLHAEVPREDLHTTVRNTTCRKKAADALN